MMALHFDCLLTGLEEDQVTDYLHLLKEQHNTPSDSYFKAYSVWSAHAIAGGRT